MIWRGKKLNTVREWITALEGLKDELDGQEFLLAIDSFPEGEPDIIRSNIGWILGYMNRDEATRIYKLLDGECKHPALPGPGGHDATPEEAFQAGLKYAIKKPSEQPIVSRKGDVDWW